MLEIRPARFADALALAPLLRFEDAREIAACWGLGGREGLVCCLLNSDRAYAVSRSGVIRALWGVTDVHRDDVRLGVPWLLASEAFFADGRSLVLQSREWVRALLLDYDVLVNATDARNRSHLRWLTWCGFSLLRYRPSAGAAGGECEAGASGGAPRLVEFYMVSERCRWPAASLRGVLARAAPAAPGMAPEVARLAALGIRCLGGTGADLEAALPELLALLAPQDPGTAVSGADVEGGWREVLPERARHAALGLLEEIAARHGATDSAVTAQPSRRFCATLRRLTELRMLDAPRGPEDLLLRRGPRPEHRGAPCGPPSGGGPAPRGGAARPLDLLARRYVRELMGAFGESRIQCYRLRAEALGVTERDQVHPPGLHRRQLERLVREHHVALSLSLGGRLAMSELARRSAERLATPLRDGQARARLVGALEADSSLGRALEAVMECWAVESAAGTVSSMRQAVDLASAVADRMALRLLPGLRLGALVSGYGERHRLYRLLRSWLVTAVARDGGALARALTQQDVVALLLGAAFEDALLDARPGAAWDEQLEAVLARCLEAFGPGVAVDDGYRHLTELLIPAVAHPAAPAAQLGSALAVWLAAADGRLAEVIGRVSGLVDAEALGPRPRLRRFLRRLGRSADMVEVRRHLGLEGHGGDRELRFIA